MHQWRLGIRMCQLRFLGASAVFILIAFILFGLAQAAEPDEYKGWKFTIVPYIWMTSLHGEIGAKGHTADVDVSFSDIWDNLDLAFMSDFEVHKDRFGFIVNPLYCKLQDSSSTEILDQKVSADVTMNMFILEFGVDYIFGPFPLSGTSGKKMPSVVVRPLIGGRYTYLDNDIDSKGLTSRSFEDSKSWIDPVIGVQTQWNFTERWNLLLGGNIGGFGVGSQFAWSAIGLAGYRFNFSKSVTGNVLLGYRALYQQYKTGTGRDYFEWDTTMYGPILGLSIGF